MARKKIIKRCVKPYPTPMVISREFKEIVNFIKAKHLIQGKKPPSDALITRIIASKINKEELLHDEFIKF